MQQRPVISTELPFFLTDLFLLSCVLYLLIKFFFLFYLILEKKEDMVFDVHFCNRRRETSIELWSWKPGTILRPSTLNYLSGKMQRSVFPNQRPLVVILPLDCILLVDIFHTHLSPHTIA